MRLPWRFDVFDVGTGRLDSCEDRDDAQLPRRRAMGRILRGQRADRLRSKANPDRRALACSALFIFSNIFAYNISPS